MAKLKPEQITALQIKALAALIRGAVPCDFALCTDKTPCFGCGEMLHEMELVLTGRPRHLKKYKDKDRYRPGVERD